MDMGGLFDFHHSTIQKNTTKYHPHNEESDHPNNLAKDQEMRKNIRKEHFKTTFKLCIRLYMKKQNY